MTTTHRSLCVAASQLGARSREAQDYILSRVSSKAIISIITIISQGHNKYLETESIINPTLSFSITITLHYYIACHGMVPTSELDISINSANLPSVFIYPFIVDAILHSQFRVSPKKMY